MLRVLSLIDLTNWRQFFWCVCPLIDHKFRHNTVKVAVDPWTTLAMLWRNSLSITGQKNLLQFVSYDNKSSNCPFSLLMHRINYKFICLSAYWQRKLANECARTSAVNVKKCVQMMRVLKVAGSSFQYFTRVRVWWVIITNCPIIGE